MFDYLRRPPHPTAQECDPDAGLRSVISQRFRDAREYHGFEQVEAAKRIDIAQDVLAAIEAAKLLPTIAILIRASVAFGVAVDFLLGLSEADETDPTTLDRFAALRHLRQLMERQAATVLDATLAELQRAAPQAAYARDLVNAAQRVITAFTAPAALPKGVRAAERSPALLGAVQTLAEVTQVTREWLARQDRLAERVAARVAEPQTISPTCFSPTSFQPSKPLQELS